MGCAAKRRLVLATVLLALLETASFDAALTVAGTTLSTDRNPSF
jgi:hypothetical protein